jgi:hypothetical protein
MNNSQHSAGEGFDHITSVAEPDDAQRDVVRSKIEDVEPVAVRSAEDDRRVLYHEIHHVVTGRIVSAAAIGGVTCEQAWIAPKVMGRPRSGVTPLIEEAAAFSWRPHFSSSSQEKNPSARTTGFDSVGSSEEKR